MVEQELANRVWGGIMQCMSVYVGMNGPQSCLTELYLKSESCRLMCLPAMSVKQQVTEFKGESNVVIPIAKHACLAVSTNTDLLQLGPNPCTYIGAQEIKPDCFKVMLCHQ